MPNIFDAPTPSQRWALPEDTKWDIWYDRFEGWLNDNYDMKSQSIAGYTTTWEDACESEDLLDLFIEMRQDNW